MPERNPDMDLLAAIRDVGVPDRLPATIEARADAALSREIAHATSRSHRKILGRAVSMRRASSPIAAIAATAAIVAIVIIAVSSHHQHAPTAAVHGGAPGSRVPAPSTLVPAEGGLPGLVFGVSAYGAGSTVRVSFVQCTNCKTTTSTPRDAKEIQWSGVSTDGAQHWQTHRSRSVLIADGLATPEGPNVWAENESNASSGFVVSHDSGQTFHRVAARARGPLGPVTLGDGEAWTLGYRCAGRTCASSVLHGSANGDRLSKTTSEPPLPSRPITGALELSGYGHLAYLIESRDRSDNRDRLYMTSDNGTSWTKTSYPCPANDSVHDLSATSDGVVWVTCEPESFLTAPSSSSERNAEHAALVMRSVDSGRTWQSPDPHFDQITALVSTSPQIAWAELPNGDLARTANGGNSWQTVLQGAGRNPSVDIVSDQIANVVVTATTHNAAQSRRTALVAYRTTDGGNRWTHTIVSLHNN
jgi:hypothetical protein